MAILEFSKIVMYKFDHNYLLHKFSPQDMKLCYMDIDSFVYIVIKEDDVYDSIINPL